MNILISSAGGPAAVGVIKSLRNIDFEGRIVSIDCNEVSVGRYLSDKFYKVPQSTDKSFIKELLDIVERESIDLILPTGLEIVPISQNISLLGDTVAFMSDHETIMLCNDKFEFYNKCKDDFPLPKTFISSFMISTPFVKPRIEIGGSRGAFLCKNKEHFDILKEDYDYVFQEYLPGQEYTIDVLCDMKSNPLIIIPRKRLETKAGISSKGEIIKDDIIEKLCYDICKFLKLKGPVCLQMKDDVNGNPKFIEINPRFGGGTYFTTLAGVNFCEIILDLINKRAVNISNPESITVLRYFEEVVIWNC